MQISIRQYSPSDTSAMIEAIEESRKQVSEWMDWCHPTYALSDAEEWVEVTQKGRESASTGSRTAPSFATVEARVIALPGFSVRAAVSANSVQNTRALVNTARLSF